MKKKFMLAVAAIFAAASLSLSSCGGSPAEKMVDIYKDATEQFKGASSKDELREIKKEAEAKIEEVVRKNSDYKETNAEENAAMLEAINEFKKAYKEAKKKF